MHLRLAPNAVPGPSAERFSRVHPSRNADKRVACLVPFLRRRRAYRTGAAKLLTQPTKNWPKELYLWGKKSKTNLEAKVKLTPTPNLEIGILNLLGVFLTLGLLESISTQAP
jgi:hypothetical protein